VADDEEDQEKPGEPEDEQEATTVFTRVQLEKMGHSEVKEIALGLGLPPRKARENMIQAILEAQGIAETTPDAPVEPQPVTVAPVDSGASESFLESLETILESFGSRFMGGLDDWLTKFSTAAEGFMLNVTPEEPMEVEPQEPTRRRLVRR
jgi:hypothetical protein